MLGIGVYIRDCILMIERIGPNESNYTVGFQIRERLSALAILLTSAGRAGDTIVYISIRQMALLA